MATPSREAVAHAAKFLARNKNESSRQPSLARARPALAGSPSAASINLGSQSFLPQVQKASLNSPRAPPMNPAGGFKYTVRDLSKLSQMTNIN